MYSKEQIAEANNYNIMALVQSEGMPFEKKGNEYHIRGYGGLFVNPEKNMFTCFSRTGSNGKNLGGKGALNFAQQILGYDFKSAMKMIVGIESKPFIPNETYRKDKQIPDRSAFVVPPKSDNSRQTFAYLAKTRRVDPDLISEFMKKGLLYQTYTEKDGKRHENGVFIHRNAEGKPCGAEIFGLSSFKRFKKNVAPDETDRGFVYMKGEKPKTVYLFEAAIDLMSFVQLHPEIENAKFVSMSGLKPTIAAHYINDTSVKVVSCVDNDAAGKAFNRTICIGKIEAALKDDSAQRKVSSGDPPIEFFHNEKNGKNCFYFTSNEDYKAAAESDPDLVKDSSIFVWKNTSSFEINHECADIGFKDFNEVLVMRMEEKDALKRCDEFEEVLSNAVHQINENILNNNLNERV